MPAFERAEVSDSAQDLAEHKSFLRSLKVGQIVTLPLEGAESTRGVMRALNAAAAQSKMRLTRLPSTGDAVRFKVASPEKRQVTMTEEQKRARADKARATRAAHRGGTTTEGSPVAETGPMPVAQPDDQSATQADQQAQPARRGRRSRASAA